MSDLYGVLGLPRNASEDEIKATYRTLVRQLHPDVNAGDEASAQRLRDINRAYGTLGNAQVRAEYDRDLARRRGEAWRRHSIVAAMTVATFALTMTVVSFAVRWHLQAAAPGASPPPAPEKGMAWETQPGRAELAALPQPKPGANWTTYRNASFGFALRYPAGIFVLDSRRSTGNVRTFVSRDGRAVLRILASENMTGTTPARLRRTLMKKRYAGASFDAAPRRKYWFALSGTRGDDVFLERVTFSCDRKSMHGWQMTYPSSERATYDKVAKLVLRNYPHGNGPGAGCSEVQTRSRARRARR
jgi:curved DNA-binding protein CbpA